MLTSDLRTQLMNEHSMLPHSGALKLSPELYFVSTKCQKGQFRWPRDLRHVSVTSLTLIVGSNPARGMDVCLL